MNSIEADVFSVEGQLLVAHSRAELDPRTRWSNSTWNRCSAGRENSLELLVDIKSDPEVALNLLEQELTANPPPKNTVVILSGSRPKRAPRLPYLTVEGTVAEFRSQSLPPNCRYVSGPWWAESFTGVRLEDLVKQVQ